MFKSIAITLSLLFVSPVIFALPSSAQKELDTFVSIFSDDDTFKQLEVAKSLEWSGYSQPILFDLIEAKLLENYNSPSPKYAQDVLAWFAKSLGYSGNVKYMPTLNKIASQSKSKKLRKYGAEASGTLPKYTSWNKTILSEDNWNSEEPLKLNRFRNMINSDSYELKRLVAKRIHYSHSYEREYMSLLETELLKGYKDASSQLQVDTYAWMAKALAGSRNMKYKPTVEKVMTGAKSSKLQRYARKYMKYYK